MLGGIREIIFREKSKDGASTASEEEDYDPHLHRTIENPTTNIETFVHLMKCCLGTGILAMPNAFKNAGLLVGSIGTILVGVICTYCIHVLIRHQYQLCKRNKIPLLSYRNSVKVGMEQGPPNLKCFIPVIIPMVDIALVVYQLGICCVYIVFIANSIKEIADHFWMKIDIRLIMMVVTVPLIGISMIRSLRILTPFSILANLITFVGLGIIIYYIFTPSFPSITSVPMFGSPLKYALFYGTVLFALESIGFVVVLENSMLTPKSFLGCFGVLNQGMGLTTFLYLLFGFIGYVKYGEEAKGSISLNLPKDNFLGGTVIISFAISIFISYTLQFYVPIEIIWKTWIKDHLSESEMWIEYVMRAGLVLMTLCAGLLVPLLGLFISLFGSLCLPFLGFALPALLEYVVLWPDRKNNKWWTFIVIKDSLLFFFSIFSSIMASVITIIQIHYAMSHFEE